MTKRINTNVSAHRVTTGNRNYLVNLERINPDRNGNRRYKAIISYYSPRTSYYYNAVYTFTGHCMSEQDEAAHIVNYWESEQKRAGVL